MNTKGNNIINNWLNENGNPEIDKFVKKNLAITEKVHAILNERCIKKSEFAKSLGKNPSEVTKWLSGMHNLTLKSIIKMEHVLGVNLINIEPEIKVKYVFLGLVKGGNLKNAIKDSEQTHYEESNVKYA